MAHLADIFKVGGPSTIVLHGQEESDLQVWVTRPNSPQQELVKKKSKSARARRYLELAPDEEEGIAVRLEVGAMKKADVVDAIVARKNSELRKQAFNEVLFSEDYGSDWGTEGDKYLDVIQAILDRTEEIEAWNVEQKAAGLTETVIDVFADDDITRLNAEQEKFSAEVTERTEELLHAERSDVASTGIEALRERLIKERIELESDMEWMVARRYGLLHFAIRDMEDHSKLYFESMTDIQGLPEYIQEQLFRAYEGIELGVEDVKNSLTPLLS